MERSLVLAHAVPVMLASAAYFFIGGQTAEPSLTIGIACLVFAINIRSWTKAFMAVVVGVALMISPATKPYGWALQDDTAALASLALGFITAGVARWMMSLGENNAADEEN